MSQDDHLPLKHPHNPDKDLPPQMFRSGKPEATTKIKMYKEEDRRLKNVMKAKYSVIDEEAIFEGDIMIGDYQKLKLAEMAPETYGIGIPGDYFRWGEKGARQVDIPYVTVDELKEVVAIAIAEWESKTPFRFVKHTTEEGDYLSFEKLRGCWSYVGRRGGKQTISLGSGCGSGAAIHEIGHALGLWHEQSRSDRDKYVTIIDANISDSQKHNFDKHILDGVDLGTYDYESIMHYPPTAFSKNGQPTIVAKNGEPIGQRDGLSAGDIEAIRILYPDLEWNSKNPDSAPIAEANAVLS